MTPSAALTELLRVGAGGRTWVAATVGSEVAASYQLAVGAPVMAVGGYNGTDPSPTLASFQTLARAGAIHWFIDSGVSGVGTGGSAEPERVTDWVHRHFRSRTVDGTNVWDLTTPTG